MSALPRVVLLRGHNANVWDLRPFEALQDEFDLSVLVTGSNLHNLQGLDLPIIRVATPRDRLPGSGRIRGGLAYALGERYLGLERYLRDVAIVHGAELATWFTAQAAELKAHLGFRLVATAWETLPWGATYRWPRERRYRAATLNRVDRWLTATERARQCLILEGVAPARIDPSPPGIDLQRFASARRDRGDYILSAGRLVWEKGHQDVIRAVAALKDRSTRLLIVGDGPERKRLEAYAAELGVNLEIRSTVPYDEMPGVFAGARALVLASLPVKGWEEQFGMVLVEALASGTPVVTTNSGAIPEVVGDAATLVPPGGWFLIADALKGSFEPVEANLARFSAEAAAARLRATYRSVL